MRLITELIGGIALLAIFAYGVAYIIEIIRHMEIKNGKNDTIPRMGTDSRPNGDDGKNGEKPN